jgi:hypothetical protein
MSSGGRASARRIAGWLLAAVAAFGACRPGAPAGQDPPAYTPHLSIAALDFVTLGGYDSALWFVHGDTLFAIELPGDSVSIRRPVGDVLEVFEEPYGPRWSSSSIDGATGEVWMWDGTVGPVARFGLRSDTVQRSFDVYLSRIQGGHGGGLHPRTGRPVAFGGYGYYRVHDLLVTFDDRARTWVEMATRGTDRPEARMAAVMVTGWHPTKLALVGGMGQASRDTPSRFDRVMADAWTFDVADSAWARIRIAEPVRCALASGPQVGDYIVEPASRSVLLFSAYGCPPDPSHNSGEILRWYPESGGFETVARLGQALPVGFALSGMVLSRDSSRIHVLLSRLVEGDHLARADRRVLSFERTAASLAPPATDKPPVGPWTVIPIGLLVLAVAALVLWLLLRRRGVHGLAEVRMGAEGAPVLVRCGRRARSRPLSPNAHRLLAALLLLHVAPGDILPAERLGELFDELYADPDSARVAKNRAVDELNQLFAQVCGRPLLERVRRTDDARRFDWKVVADLRAA